MIAVVAVVLAIVVASLVTWLIRKNIYEKKIGSAEDKSRQIIDEAVKTAETKKREALLEAKEENLRAKNEWEKELRERNSELQKKENRIQSKEESIDKKTENLERREQSLTAREENFNKRREELETMIEEEKVQLERISGLTSEEAKTYLLRLVEDDIKHDTAKIIKENDAYAREESEKKAKEYIVTAIQKCAADHVAETTISVVSLPNDDMKGRIIGREGRNISALETLTGV
ncbi:MAG: DUF3552 domain-containing protein, partial [Lachnospiraceae bacterium]|nr:DUF3552 domain-containing protein [Candidatus Minthocola equi]